MRSYDKNDEYDRNEAEEIGATSWMLDALEMNEGYVHWGGGLREITMTWSDFAKSPWVDGLNEPVLFAFEVHRPAKDCDTCGSDWPGEHPDASWVVKSFYHHSSPFTLSSGPSQAFFRKYPSPAFREFVDSMRRAALDDRFWQDKITPDEFEALRAKNRLHAFTLPPDVSAGEGAALVNAQACKRGCMGHDGINRAILTQCRLERFGLPLKCPTCDGRGFLYTEPQAQLNLMLWVLHPRLDTATSLRVTSITQADLPSVYAFLRQLADRHASRFAKVPKE